MSHRIISMTIIKLFAIGLIIFAFQNAGSALFFMASDADLGPPAWADVYLIVTAIVIPALAALLLWTRPLIVINPGVNVRAGEAERTLDAAGVFGVGVGLIGISVMAAALGSIFEWLFFH